MPGSPSPPPSVKLTAAHAALEQWRQRFWLDFQLLEKLQSLRDGKPTEFLPPNASAPRTLEQAHRDRMLEELQRAQQQIADLLSACSESERHSFGQSLLPLLENRNGRELPRTYLPSVPPEPSGQFYDLMESWLTAGLDAGWFAWAPVAGQAPAPRHWSTLAKFVAEHRFSRAFAQRLLAWPDAGKHLYSSPRGLVAINTSSGSVPPFQSGITPWSWMVRNHKEWRIQDCLDAGADANAYDGQGRPVLAWAREENVVRALLEYGADPLAPALPLEQRLRSLHAVLAGAEHWAFGVREQLAGLSDDANAWDQLEPATDVLAIYVRQRLQAWTPAERAQALRPFRAQWWLGDCLKLQPRVLAKVWSPMALAATVVGLNEEGTTGPSPDQDAALALEVVLCCLRGQWRGRYPPLEALASLAWPSVAAQRAALLAFTPDGLEHQRAWAACLREEPAVAAQIVRWLAEPTPEPVRFPEAAPPLNLLVAAAKVLTPDQVCWEDWWPLVSTSWEDARNRFGDFDAPDAKRLLPAALWWSRHAPTLADAVHHTYVAACLAPALVEMSASEQVQFWDTVGKVATTDAQLLEHFQKQQAHSWWGALSKWRANPQAQAVMAAAQLGVVVPEAAGKPSRPRL